MMWQHSINAAVLTMISDARCVAQAKGVAKKLQQSTPKGSPTKPQPLQRAGPLEAAKVHACFSFVFQSCEGYMHFTCS